MNKEIKLCVTIPDDVKMRLKCFFDARRHEELTRMALLEVANMLLASVQSKKIKIAQFIRENIDALVQEYAEEYPAWEYKALRYASEHKHGIPNLLIKDIYYDKIWTKEYPKASNHVES